MEWLELTKNEDFLLSEWTAKAIEQLAIFLVW
jgi:hypothetical protein